MRAAFQATATFLAAYGAYSLLTSNTQGTPSNWCINALNGNVGVFSALGAIDESASHIIHCGAPHGY